MNAIVPLSQMRPSEARVGWTDEVIGEMTGLAKQGLSAGQIAAQLSSLVPNITRNAVIGKLTRLGLRGGGAGMHNRGEPRPPRAPRRPRRHASLPGPGPVERALQEAASRLISPNSDGSRDEPASSVSPPRSRTERSGLRPQIVVVGTQSGPSEPIDPFIGITFFEIRNGLCKFPRGEATDLDDIRFCGSAAGEGPYCPFHAALTYVGAPQQTKQQGNYWR